MLLHFLLKLIKINFNSDGKNYTPEGQKQITSKPKALSFERGEYMRVIRRFGFLHKIFYLLESLCNFDQCRV
jgi:hypothetical protein